MDTRLAEPRPGRLHIVYHSIAWQYFPPATRTTARAALDAAGARATPDAPLAHIALEGDGDSHGAALQSQYSCMSGPLGRLTISHLHTCSSTQRLSKSILTILDDTT